MTGKSLSIRAFGPRRDARNATARCVPHAEARAIVLAMAATCFASPCLAHEFWLQPDQFRLQPGTETPVRIFVGERFRGEELPCDASRVAEFRHLSASGEENLNGEEGAAPAAWLHVDDPGLHLLAYRSHPAALELAAERFNGYLLDDGHYRTLAARLAAGTYDAPGRERFARYAKALLVCDGTQSASTAGGVGAGQVGDSMPTPNATPMPTSTADASLAMRAVGHRLEIIPETDAHALADGASEIAVRVLFEGEPLGGAVIFATPAGNPEKGLLRTLTHVDGRCRFSLASTGPWMISLVHMIECRDCPDADWDSSWATLVFARGDVVAASLSSAR